MPAGPSMLYVSCSDMALYCGGVKGTGEFRMRNRLRRAGAWLVLLLAAGLILLPLRCRAAGRKRVAVLEFRDRAGLDPTDLDYLTDAVVRGAVRRALSPARYLLMTKESMITLLEDRGIQMEKVCEGSCEVDVGRKIGAHYIVTGSVWKVGGELEVTVRLFSTRTGDLLGQENVRGPDVASVRDPLAKAADLLLSSLRSPRRTTASVGPLAPEQRAAPEEIRGTVPEEKALQGAGGEARVPEVLPPPGAPLAPAGLYITTDPPGAEVYLDSVRVGTTSPAFQKGGLRAGSRVRISLRMKGYEEKSFEVKLEPRVMRFGRIRLARKTFTLNVFAEPPLPGARVLLDGDETGRQAPDTLEGIPVGEHIVEVRTHEMAGRARVSGRGGERVTVTVALKDVTWKEPVTGMEFVWVPGGCYEMGVAESEAGLGSSNNPVHEVCLDGFWMGRTEVTEGQWRRVMGKSPSGFQSCGDDCPVQGVSWKDAAKFVKKLRRLNEGRFHFDLPTEAEWEYACRSGGRREVYAGGDDLDEVAWYKGTAGRSAHPVGRKAPNGLGIYDMSGNVKEWCRDWYDARAYEKHQRKNPVCTEGRPFRLARGGSWYDHGSFARCTHRVAYKPGYRSNGFGFRLVRKE